MQPTDEADSTVTTVEKISEITQPLNPVSTEMELSPLHHASSTPSTNKGTLTSEVIN